MVLFGVKMMTMMMMMMMMMTMLVNVSVCSLRALYGTDIHRNGVHASSSCQEAQLEIRFFFHNSWLCLVTSEIFRCEIVQNVTKSV